MKTPDLEKDVADFFWKFKQNMPDKPTLIKNFELRHQLISEELEEYWNACKKGDLVEVTDALMDMLYVVIGSALAHGIRIEDYWKEVHRTNMKKQGGSTRKDGKILKPQGWEPPRIAEILNRALED